MNLLSLSMRYLLLSLFFISLGIVLASAPFRSNRTHPSILLNTSSEQLLNGADLYFHHCSACHGDTALGFAEAKTTFPEDYQNCKRCHRTNNPSSMDINTMTWRSAFNIGEAPALRGENSLIGLENGLALYSYIKATMPRPFLTSLSDAEYLAITAFILEINNANLNSDFIIENASDFNIPKQ